MATLPSTLTASVGNKITAAIWNTYVRDPIAFLSAVPRVSASQTSGTSITTGTTTLVLWDTEAWDSDVMHDTATNTSRLIAKTAGMYDVAVTLSFPSNATGWRYLMIRKNSAGSAVGGSLIWQGFSGALAVSQNTLSIALDIPLAANDYLEVFGSQNSGSTLVLNTGANGSSIAQMRWVASS